MTDEVDSSSAAIMETMSPQDSLILGSRKSRLAIVQTELVMTALKAYHPHLNLSILGMSTVGDKNLTSPLHLMGGKALWTEELDEALSSGKVDVVVHSLKDVPTIVPEGMEIIAVMEREDPRDVLVVREGLEFRELEELPSGSVIGTSSVRRIAQLRRRFPHFEFQDVRGNLNTRLAKLDAPDSPYTALVLAAAGLIRINLSQRISSFITPPTLFHAVGQGALGIQVRSSLPSTATSSERDRIERVKDYVKLLDHCETAWRCEAERSLLRQIEGGCSVPVGVTSRITTHPPSLSPSLINSTTSTGPVTLELEGVVTSMNGLKEVQGFKTALITCREDARRLGAELAQELIQNGAREILQELGKLKQVALSKVDDEAQRNCEQVVVS